MAIYFTGLILFFVPHFYSAMRSRAVDKDIRKAIGEAKYMSLYSVITGIGLALMIWGYRKTPSADYIYAGPHELHHYAWVFMLPAFILLAAAYTPTGHIKRAVQHPMMLATLIWALSHLALGGDLKKILLFGGFAAYSLVSLICAYRRGTNLKQQNPKVLGDVLAVFIGAALTGLLMHGGHQFAFGASPM